MKSHLHLLVFGLILFGCTPKTEKPSEKVEQPQDMSVAAFSLDNKHATFYTTAKSTDLRLSNSGHITFNDSSEAVETQSFIFVNTRKRFQTLLGIGGAITDASAEVFAKLPKAKQEELLKAYYDKKEGIGYSFARTSIHSSDFSSGSYTYVSDQDKDLKTFNIDHDRLYRIPLIKKAIAAAGGTLTMFASPWSPPAFMKSNNTMLQGGKLLPEYNDSWALYYTKFIKAYEKEGIPIWGITIQNEPMAVQTWESCNYTATDERDFLKNYLGPTMEKEGLGDKKIVVWDHNRDFLNLRANTIFGDPEAAKYAWGIGYHWYETWTGGEAMNKNLGKVHEAYPDKHILFTEGCVDKFNAAELQDWSHGEKYGRNMIKDFNEGNEGWADWNILLDMQGGPNHVGNFCFAPIHADVDKGELIYTPSYYYLGHFSKFIRPNAERVSNATSRSTLLSCSFLNEDGSLVTVVMNQTDKEIAYKLYIDSSASLVKIQPHAIQTVVVK